MNIMPKRTATKDLHRYCIPVFTVTLFTTAKRWKDHNVHDSCVAKRKGVQCWYVLQQKPWEHYTKWKQARHRTTIMWFHLHEIPSVVKFMETESRQWLPGAGGGEWWEELVFQRNRVSVWEDGKVLKIDGGDDSTTMWIYLMSLKCTLKCYKGKIKKGRKGNGEGKGSGSTSPVLCSPHSWVHGPQLSGRSFCILQTSHMHLHLKIYQVRSSWCWWHQRKKAPVLVSRLQ